VSDANRTTFTRWGKEVSGQSERTLKEGDETRERKGRAVQCICLRSSHLTGSICLCWSVRFPLMLCAQTFDFLNDLRLKYGSDATGIALVSGFEVFSSAQPTPFWVNEVANTKMTHTQGRPDQTSAVQCSAAESPLALRH